MKKMYLLNEKKTEFITSSEMKCAIIIRLHEFYSYLILSFTGWGESSKVIVQVSVAVFFGRCRNIIIR